MITLPSSNVSLQGSGDGESIKHNGERYGIHTEGYHRLVVIGTVSVQSQVPSSQASSNLYGRLVSEESIQDGLDILTELYINSSRRSAFTPRINSSAIGRTIHPRRGHHMAVRQSDLSQQARRMSRLGYHRH